MSKNNTKKPTLINSNPRNLLSGRLKRPSKELPNPSINSTTKKPFLKEYSTAMEQKLSNLKQKIQEKKKEKEQKVDLQISTKNHLQKFFTKSNNFKKVKEQNKLEDKLAKVEFFDFLTKINMAIYQQILLSNEINTLEILKEATQKELEEIGIAKGHVLKIKVSLQRYLLPKKIDQKKLNEVIAEKKTIREVKTKDSQRINYSQLTQNSNKEQKIKTVCESISIGTTDQLKFEDYSKRNSKFCLFCYQSFKVPVKMYEVIINEQFCSESCQQHYNLLFKRYETNLIRAEEEFKNEELNNDERKHKQEQQDQSDESNYDLLNNFSVLDFTDENFDFKQYEKAKEFLS